MMTTKEDITQLKDEIDRLRQENEELRTKTRRMDEEGRLGFNREVSAEKDFQMQAEQSHHSEAPTDGTAISVGYIRRHPFIDGIMETPLPAGWKSLTIDRYDDTIDLDEHVDAYITQISLFTTDDAIFYRAFPSSLKGPALNWYMWLPLQSIDSFDTLV